METRHDLDPNAVFGRQFSGTSTAENGPQVVVLIVTYSCDGESPQGGYLRALIGQGVLPVVYHTQRNQPMIFIEPFIRSPEPAESAYMEYFRAKHPSRSNRLDHSIHKPQHPSVTPLFP